MSYSDEMRKCLEDCDVAGVRRLWRHVAPGMPQIDDDGQALIAVHMARTQSSVVSLRARAYSHRWLVDGGYPSQLPDDLRPKAEKMFPRPAEGVGLSLNAKSELMRAILPHVEKAMTDSILESYANMEIDPVLVKRRMFEAKENVERKLLGLIRREG